MVPRIGLVRDPLDDRVGHRRRIGVDLDAAPQLAAVVVVRRPGLVRDVLVVDRFALRKPDQLGRALRQLRGQPRDDIGQLLRRDRVVFAPDPVALLERAVPGQDGVDRLVRRLELGLGRAVRRDAVVELDFLLERDLGAGELAGGGLQADELRFQPLAAIVFETVQRVAEPGSVLRSEPGSRSSSASIRSLISAGP